MDIGSLGNDIQGLRYVVMRNWEKMPPDGDIDFFVHPDDKKDLEDACVRHLGDSRWYDIRTVGDHYFHPSIERQLLEESPRRYNGFKIPNRRAHFLSLYYHGVVHKGDDRYNETLKQIFWDWLRPMPPDDKGVGYHDPR